MIYLGKITMSFGIKGELKLYTNVSFKEKALKKDFPIYINKTKHIITNVRQHKNFYLVTIDGLDNINLIEEFRNQKVYVLESDISLDKDEVIIETLVGFIVMEAQEKLGKIVDIMYNKNAVLLKVLGDKNFYIPYNDYFIKKVIKEEKKILTEHAKDLIL